MIKALKQLIAFLFIIGILALVWDIVTTEYPATEQAATPPVTVTSTCKEDAFGKVTCTVTKE